MREAETNKIQVFSRKGSPSNLMSCKLIGQIYLFSYYNLQARVNLSGGQSTWTDEETGWVEPVRGSCAECGSGWLLAGTRARATLLTCGATLLGEQSPVL